MVTPPIVQASKLRLLQEVKVVTHLTQLLNLVSLIDSSRSLVEPLLLLLFQFTQTRR